MTLPLTSQQTQNICITFIRCWTETLGRRCINVIQMFCVCCDNGSEYSVTMTVKTHATVVIVVKFAWEGWGGRQQQTQSGENWCIELSCSRY